MTNTNKIKPPLLPLDELEDICNRATKGMVWAVGKGTNEQNKKEWYVYSSSEKTANRLPKSYRGSKVVVIFASRPRILKK